MYTYIIFCAVRRVRISSILIVFTVRYTIRESVQIKIKELHCIFFSLPFIQSTCGTYHMTAANNPRTNLRAAARAKSAHNYENAHLKNCSVS